MLGILAVKFEMGLWLKVEILNAEAVQCSIFNSIHNGDIVLRSIYWAELLLELISLILLLLSLSAVDVAGSD
jgi:hypothetical protein